MPHPALPNHNGVIPHAGLTLEDMLKQKQAKPVQAPASAMEGASEADDRGETAEAGSRLRLAAAFPQATGDVECAGVPASALAMRLGCKRPG